jgi:hypothetical protein
MRYSMIVASLLSSVSTVAYAQVTFVIGMGLNSCSMYLSAVENHPPGMYRAIERQEGKFVDEHARYDDWLAGFVTASNWWAARTGTGNGISVDPPAIDVWVKRWCEQNPTKNVVEAASAFVQERRR